VHRKQRQDAQEAEAGCTGGRGRMHRRQRQDAQEAKVGALAVCLPSIEPSVEPCR